MELQNQSNSLFVIAPYWSSGTWYRTADGREGWLCPALLKYFPVAPKDLYVKAEALSEFSL